MKPVRFPHANLDLVAPTDQPDVQTLPVFQGDGYFVSCWALTWPQRIKLLFTGRLWFWVLGSGHPPIRPDVEDPWSLEGRADQSGYALRHRLRALKAMRVKMWGIT